MTRKQAIITIARWRELRKNFSVDKKTGQIDLFSIIVPQSSTKPSAKTD